ncbi:hypothetical protein AB2B41_01700 [Marimonas sp. MJW-29]|uniref:Uncharacterized protein n=1 Tax=Sulfitobacter sediminis TaxID=3234186 RepID=A0ABV3RID0_9RHOB
MNPTPASTAAHLDRPSETAMRNLLQRTPWATEAQRGAYALDRDISEHRKSHSLFEDLMN